MLSSMIQCDGIVRKCPVIKIRIMILIRKQQFGLFVNEKLQRNSEDFASD